MEWLRIGVDIRERKTTHVVVAPIERLANPLHFNVDWAILAAVDSAR